MSDLVNEVIGLNVDGDINRVVEGLIKIVDGIKDVNNLKIDTTQGVSQSIAALKDLSAQLDSTYEGVTVAQKRATAAILDLAKAEKIRAEANLIYTKAAAIAVKTTIEQTDADTKQAAAAQKTADALEKKAAATEKANAAGSKQQSGNDLLSSPVVVTNDSQATPSNATGSVVNPDEIAEINAIAAAQSGLTATINTTTNAAQQEAAAFLDNLSATQELIQEQLILKQQVADIGLRLKENAASLKDGSASEEEYSAAAIKLTEQLSLLNVELTQVNAQIKRNAQEMIVDQGSIDQMEIAVKQLEIERDKQNLTTQEGTVRQRELNEQINEYNSLIKISKDSLAQQKINVGNYPTLSAELREVTTSLEQLTAQGITTGEEWDALSAKALQLRASMATVKGATTESSGGFDLVDKVSNRLLSTFVRFIATTLIFSTIVAIINESKDAITAYYDATHAAETEQRNFNAALIESQKAATTDLAVLEQLQASLNNSTVSRKDLASEINNAVQKYPEYLNNLSSESLTTNQINDAITRQIDLINQRTQTQAALKTLADAQQKVNEAQDKYNSILDGSIGYWQKAGLGVVSFTNSTTTATEKEVLLKGATEEYNQALELKNIALQRATNNTQFQIDTDKKAVSGLEEHITATNKLIDSYKKQGELNQVPLLENENAARLRIIGTINLQIKALQDEQNQRLVNNSNQLSLAQIAALNADTELKNTQKGTQAYVNALKTKNAADLAQQEEALRNKYKANNAAFESDSGYLAEKANLEATARNKEDTAQTQADKKSLSALNKQNTEENKARQARIAADKEATDIERDRQNALSEQNIQTNKAIYEDETKTLAQRTEAYAEYYAGKNRQAAADRDKQKADLLQLQQEIETIEQKPISKRSDADNALILRKQNIADRLVEIDNQYQATVTENATNAASETVKIFKSVSEEIDKELQARIVKIKSADDDANNAELISLLNLLKKKQISYQDYENKKRNIITASTDKETTDEIVAINNVLLTEKLSVDETEKLEKQKEALKKQRQDVDLNNTEDNEKLKQKQIEATLDASKQVIDSIGSAEDTLSKSRQDNLDLEDQKIKDNLQSQVDAINASSASQTDKDAAIKDASERAAASEAKIAEDKRKAQITQAKTDKAIAIANIILNTSLAEVKAFTEGDPYTKIIRAAAAGLAGATALAVAIATPIPQYAKGTNYHKGGLMIVGDGGERELIKQPGKPDIWSPDTDTLMYAASGTSITPESKMSITDRLMMDIYSGQSSFNSGSIAANTDIRPELEKINQGLSHLAQVTQNKEHFTINVTNKGIEYMSKKGNSNTKYLDRVFNRKTF